LNRKYVWIAVAVVAVVVVAGWWIKSRGKTAAPKWRTATVERGSIESLVSATGTIRPVIQVQVGSQVSGTVLGLYADYNKRVKKGDVLLRLDPASFQARLAQNEAAVARADAALKDGQRQLKRAQELFPQSYISQAELDGAVLAVEQRQADLKQARATLQAAQVDLTNATIRAPIDGVVISRSVDVGQTVAASLQSPQLFLLANDLTHMQVETRIDESDIGRIHPGLPVSFTVDAFPDDQFQGKVAQVRLEPITDQGVVTYTTVIEADNPDLKLRPGMTANVSVLVEQRDDILKVPAAALRFRLPADTKNRAARAAGGGAAASPAPNAAASAAGATAGGAGAQAGTRGRWRAGGGAGAGSDTAGARIRALIQSGKITRDQGRAMFQQLRSNGAGSGAAAGRADLKPGTIYLLRDGKPQPVRVLTGITDGTTVELVSDQVKAGDVVVTGQELAAASGPALTPPPGMGGPVFRGPGGARGGGGGGRGR
jgi:HlyD family secretion protein